jgi:hypothetical protein
MLKSILNIKGVQKLEKKEQNSIRGGLEFPLDCTDSSQCVIRNIVGYCIVEYGICVF